MSLADDSFAELLKQVRQCTLCQDVLPNPPRPVIQASRQARLLIVGQAPGRRVHNTGLPFNDPSGDRLRTWMGIDRETFYDEQKIAIVPMGFCYPGTGKSGDNPPRPECAATWRTALMAGLDNIELTLAIGQYAQAWHLGQNKSKRSVTEVVADWESCWPEVIPLPHPSPRNNLWLRRNPWFEKRVVPMLQARVKLLLAPP